MPTNLDKKKTPNLDETRGPLNSIADDATRKEIAKLWNVIERRLDYAGKDPGYRLVRLDELQAIRQSITYQTLKPNELPPELAKRVSTGGDGGGEPGPRGPKGDKGDPGIQGVPGTSGAAGAPGTVKTIGPLPPGSGTIPIPANVSSGWIVAIGAGAGGQSSGVTSGGGGGGSGEMISGMMVSVPAGGTVAYTVPGGGAVDADGGSTIFGDFIALGGRVGATAGAGGRGGGVSGGLGGGLGLSAAGGLMGLASSSFWFCGSGGGGAGSSGTAPGGPGGGAGGRISGGSGGTASGTKGGGGGGAASPWGAGGNAGNGGFIGTAAPSTAYGAGGGGGGGNSQPGGAGAPGYLTFLYIG